MSVDLPLPVLPTMAVVSPGSRVERDVAQDRLLGARVAELDVAELDGRRARPVAGGRRDRRRSGSRMDGSVSRTSRIRPAETAARGTKMNMNTAIRTANRICMQVLQERGQVADRHLAAVDADARRTT